MHTRGQEHKDTAGRKTRKADTENAETSVLSLSIKHCETFKVLLLHNLNQLLDFFDPF